MFLILLQGEIILGQQMRTEKFRLRNEEFFSVPTNIVNYGKKGNQMLQQRR